MNRLACVLTVLAICSFSHQGNCGEKTVALALEETTTLSVGELAVLHIPEDRGYFYSPSDCACKGVLTFVHRRRGEVIFRAVGAGRGTVVLSPHAANGDCVSCATRHYFVQIVPHG
jgi:hypothetical protein